MGALVLIIYGERVKKKIRLGKIRVLSNLAKYRLTTKNVIVNTFSK